MKDGLYINYNIIFHFLAQLRFFLIINIKNSIFDNKIEFFIIHTKFYSSILFYNK